MCARYTLRANAGTLMELFWLSQMFDIDARYNIAPTQAVLAVTRGEGANDARLMRWGLVPFWSKAIDAGPLLINARSETLREKAPYKKLLRNQRCLIPADGFFEWKTEGKKKRPFLFEIGEHQVFAFAGLWDIWEGDGSSYIESCTIVTTSPNEDISDIHDRMPAIILREDFQNYLDPNQPIESFCDPLPNHVLHRTEVGAAVGNSRLEGANLITPAGGASQSLFEP